jgi:hypothetical protein
MEHFCDAGEDTLPENGFYVLPQEQGSNAGPRLHAFSAASARIEGRRAFIQGKAAFFVSEIIVLNPDEPQRRFKNSSRNQLNLPLFTFV